MKTLKQLRAEAAKYDCSAYRHKGRWFVYEDGTFVYRGHAEGARGCLSERAALTQAIRCATFNEKELAETKAWTGPMNIFRKERT